MRSSGPSQLEDKIGGSFFQRKKRKWRDGPFEPLDCGGWASWQAVEVASDFPVSERLQRRLDSVKLWPLSLTYLPGKRGLSWDALIQVSVGGLALVKDRI